MENYFRIKKFSHFLDPFSLSRTALPCFERLPKRSKFSPSWNQTLAFWATSGEYLPLHYASITMDRVQMYVIRFALKQMQMSLDWLAGGFSLKGWTGSFVHIKRSCVVIKWETSKTPFSIHYPRDGPKIFKVFFAIAHMTVIHCNDYLTCIAFTLSQMTASMDV